jgi:hypothetical protein
LTLASFFQADVILEQCVVPSFRVGHRKDLMIYTCSQI